MYSRSGGSKGGAPVSRPLKGPNSLVLTYKFYETYPHRELAPPPYEAGDPSLRGWRPLPTRLATPPYGKSWSRDLSNTRLPLNMSMSYLMLSEIHLECLTCSIALSIPLDINIYVVSSSQSVSHNSSCSSHFMLNTFNVYNERTRRNILKIGMLNSYWEQKYSNCIVTLFYPFPELW